MILLLAFLSTVLSLFFLEARCSQIDKINEEVNIAGDGSWSRPECNLPPTSFPPTCSTVSPFPGCDCPAGYAVVVDFSTNSSMCVKTCFGVSSVTCSDSGFSTTQCLGTSIPLVNCQLSTYLRGFACAAEVCGGKLIILADGSFFCVASIAADTGSTCPNGFSPLCSAITTSTSCNVITNLSPLYQGLSCQACGY